MKLSSLFKIIAFIMFYLFDTFESWEMLINNPGHYLHFRKPFQNYEKILQKCRENRSRQQSSSLFLQPHDIKTEIQQLPEQFKLRFQNVARLYHNGKEDEILHRLYQANVCVIGLGGVGSWVVEALARSGINKLTLIDLDDICVSNINRQVMAQSSTVGQFKTIALKERILEINPHAIITPILDFITPQNVETYLLKKIVVEDKASSKSSSASSESVSSSASSVAKIIYEPKFDYVIDAADRLTDKAAIIHACVQSQTPIVSSGGVGGLLDPTSIQINDIVDVKGDSLLMRVRRKLREDYDYPKLDNKTKLHPRKWYIRTVHSSGSSDASHSGLDLSKQKEILNCAITSSSTSTTTTTENPRGGFRACDTHFGNACFATGTLGFVIASEVVNRIALNQSIYPKIPQRNRFIQTSTIKFNTLSDGNKGKMSNQASKDHQQSKKKDSDDKKEKDNHPHDCSCGKDYCQPSSSALSTGKTLIEAVQQQPNYMSITQPLFDAHCHLQLPPSFATVHEEIALCMKENLCHISICGTCPGDDWKRITDLSSQYHGYILPNYGLHPWWITKYEEMYGKESKDWIELLREELEKNPLAGVGECGLDKSLKKEVSIERQIDYLIPHIQLACEYHRPLTLHCVSGAWGNLHQTLQTTLAKQQQQLSPTNQLKSIILHSCQSLPVDMIGMFQELSKRYAPHQLYYSFAANSLLLGQSELQRQSSSSYQKTIQLIQVIPKENLLIESDSPDQLPLFARTQQVQYNSPVIIKLSCDEIARVVGMDGNQFADLTTNNAKKAFGV